MRYYTTAPKVRRQSGSKLTSTKLRYNHLDKRKFYRVQLKTLNPLQTGTFYGEGYGHTIAFFCAQR